jgi:hypothetical protein
MYEQSRLMTKAGQAQMAKQGAPSASKVAAKRVDTKRRAVTFPRSGADPTRTGAAIPARADAAVEIRKGSRLSIFGLPNDYLITER